MFPHFVRHLCSLALAFCCLAPIAKADETPITLRALDGGVAISGLLTNFDGLTYTVATQLGEMVLEADQVACEGASCPETEATAETISLAIGDDLTPGLVPLLVESYAAAAQSTLVRSLDATGNLGFRLSGQNPSRISTLPQTAGFTFNAMAEGRADITLTRYRPTADVIAVASLGNIGRLDDPANQQIVGLDALSVVVSPANPVRALSPDQIADIFAGRIANWSAVGGPNAPIRPIITDPDMAFSQRVSEAMFGGGGVAATAQIAGSIAEVSDNVAADRYAIGVTTFAHMRGAAPVSLHMACGLTLAPTAAAIMTETYPYSERVLAYSAPQQSKEDVASLLAYIQSDAAQDAVTDAGLVGQRIATLSLDAQGQRFVSAMLANAKRDQAKALRDFLSEIEQADRLTPTFRFLPGGSDLDLKAEADVDRLARYINSRDFSSRELLFVGFTDSVGSTTRNRKLSQSRAELVKNQVLARIDPTIRANLSVTTMGYGEIAPIACNDSAHGQAANRRVEIWVRPRS